MTQTALPLSRFKVLDLTRARSGPTCVRQLADWGADVIKIEEPAGATDGFTGSRDSSDFQNLHRNKRCMTLNLKAPEGKEIFMKLAASPASARTAHTPTGPASIKSHKAWAG